MLLAEMCPAPYVVEPVQVEPRKGCSVTSPCEKNILMPMYKSALQ